MADETVTIAIDGDASGWRQTMDQIEEWAQDAARKIQRAFDKASAGIGKKFGEVRQGLGAAFGGVVNDIDDVSAALGTFSGAAGIAAVAVVGTGGLVYGLYQAANASGELNDEQSRLTEALGDLSTAVGTYVAPAFEIVIGTMAGVVESLKFGVLGFQLLAEIATRSAGVVVDKAVAAFDILIDQVNHWGTSLKLLASGDLAGFDAEVKRHSVSTREMVSAYAEVPDVLGDSLLAIHPTWQALAGLEATTGKVATTTPKASAAIRDATKATAEWSAEVTAAADLDEMLTAQILANSAAIDEAQARTAAKTAEAATAAREQAAERLATELSWADTALGLAAQIADAVVATTEEGTEARKKAALAAFRVEQGAGIAQVAISTAAAVMAAIAQSPPPSPFGLAGAAVVTAIGAIQAGLIAAAPPPQAHVGLEVGQPSAVGSRAPLAPDERMVRARVGETIEPRGGRREARQAPIVFQYQHRFFQAAEADSIRMGSSPTRKAMLAASGRTPGHR